MSGYAYLFGVLTIFFTIAGGLLVIKFRRLQGVFLAFAGSVLVALSLFHLLPDNLELAAGSNVSFKSVSIVIAVGFLVLLILERYLSVQLAHGKDNDGKYTRRGRGGWLATVYIVIHAYIEGLTIGVSFSFNFQLGLVIAIAIISHDFCDGINTVSLMLNTNNSIRNSVLMLVLVAIAPLLGVTSTLFFTIPERYLAFIVALLIGAFLYLGAGDCLPEAYEKNKPWVTASLVVAGFGLIYLVSRAISFAE